MKLRFFRTMLVAYVSVIVLVTLVMTLTFYLINRSQTLREIDLINTELLDKSATMMDATIEQAFTIADRILIDADFREIASGEDLNYYQVTRTVERLNIDSAVLSNREFHLAILIPDTQLVVTSDFTVDLQSYLRFCGIEDDQTIRVSLADASKPDAEDMLIVREGVYRDSSTPATPVISFIERDRVYRVGTVHVFIHFSKASFFSTVSSDKSGVFAIRYGDSVAISTASDSGIFIDPSKRAYSRPSSFIHELQYLYVSDDHTLEKRMSSARLLMAIIALFAVLIGTSAAYFWAGRLYRPIRYLVGIFRSRPESAADELSFIRTEALRLQVRNEHLRHQLEEYRIPLKSKAYRDAFLGTSGGCTTELIRELSEELATGARIALVSMLPQERVNDMSLRGEQNLRFVVSSLIHEEAPRRVPADVVDVDESTMALILKGPYTDDTKRSLHDLVAHIEQLHGVRLIVIIGDRIFGLPELRTSFDKAAGLLRSLPLDEKRLIVDRTSISDDRSDRFSYPQETERRLIAAIESMDHGKSTEILSTILETNYREKSLSRKSLELFINLLVGTAQRVAERAGIEIDSGELIDKMRMDGWTEASAREHLSELYGRLTEVLREARSRRDEEIGESMVAYVYSHCAEDISLLDLAEQFNLSPTYAGKAFHRYTGEPFKEFLNLTRVRHAKEIIGKQPEVKVKDLSAASGFANVTSFIRMFKRYEGITPKQYQSRLDSRGRSEIDARNREAGKSALETERE